MFFTFIYKLLFTNKVILLHMFYGYFFKRYPTLGFPPVSWLCLQTYKFTYIPNYDTQTRNMTLCVITQRVARPQYS